MEEFPTNFTSRLLTMSDYWWAVVDRECASRGITRDSYIAECIMSAQSNGTDKVRRTGVDGE